MMTVGVMMARVSPRRIASMWIQAGGRRDKVGEAVATAMCESGGDSKAVSSAGARGLWQFMPGTLSSDRCAFNPMCATREAVKLSNKGEDFSAWDCHPDSVARSGISTGDATYEGYRREFAGIKIPGLPEIGPGPEINPIFPSEGILKGLAPDIAGGADKVLGTDANFLGLGEAYKDLRGIAAFFVGAGELLLTPEGWARTGKLVGGSILILWGLRVVIREGSGVDPVKAVTGPAKKAAMTAAEIAVLKA